MPATCGCRPCGLKRSVLFNLRWNFSGCFSGQVAAGLAPLPLHPPKKSGEGSRYRGDPGCEDGTAASFVIIFLTLLWDLKVGDAVKEPPFAAPSGGHQGCLGHEPSPPPPLGPGTARPITALRGHSFSEFRGSWEKSPRTAPAPALGTRTPHASFCIKNGQQGCKEGKQKATAVCTVCPTVTRRESVTLALKQTEPPGRMRGRSVGEGQLGPHDPRHRRPPPAGPVFSLLPVSPQ